MEISNRLLLQAFSPSTHSIPFPVWFMRQAGRYMSAYRKVREKYTFEEICYTKECIIDVTKQPISAFHLDAAIIFSDILFPLKALGIQVFFTEKGPHLTVPEKIIPCSFPRSFLQEEFSALYEAIQTLVLDLKVPLIGFAGAPWTLCAFIIGKDICNQLPRVRKLLPFLEKIIISHLQLQIESGCSLVQLFDSLSHLVPKHLLHEFCIEPYKRIKKQIQNSPIIYYKATKELFPLLPKEALSIDVIDTIPDIKSHQGVIQGGLSASHLLESRDFLQKKTLKILSKMKEYPGYIFNLSSGIPPQTEESTIQFLVDLVRNFHR